MSAVKEGTMSFGIYLVGYLILNARPSLRDAGLSFILLTGRSHMPEVSAFVKRTQVLKA